MIFRVLFLCISDLLCLTNYFEYWTYCPGLTQYLMYIEMHTFFLTFDFHTLHFIPYCTYAIKLFVGNKITVFTV